LTHIAWYLYKSGSSDPNGSARGQQLATRTRVKPGLLVRCVVGALETTVPAVLHTYSSVLRTHPTQPARAAAPAVYHGAKHLAQRVSRSKTPSPVRPCLPSRARWLDVEGVPAVRVESVQLEAARQGVLNAHDGALMAWTPVSRRLRHCRPVVRRHARHLAVGHVQRIRRRLELLRPRFRGNNPQKRVLERNLRSSCT